MRRMTRDARLNASDLIRPACRRSTIMCMSYSSKHFSTYTYIGSLLQLHNKYVQCTRALNICTTNHWNMLNRVQWQGHSCWLWRFQWRDRIWATKKRVHAPSPPIHAGHPIPSTQLGVCLSDNMPCFVFRILYPVFCIQLKLILDMCLCDDNQCFVIKCVLLHSTDVLWFVQLNLNWGIPTNYLI